MGICCTSKKLYYTDVDSHEELEIRRWEETQLKSYEYTFSYLRSKLRLNSNIENKEKVVKMLKDEINEEASNFVSKTKLFDEGDKFISLNKIRAFIFLITRPEKFKSESGKSYYDKASYLIQEILCN